MLTVFVPRSTSLYSHPEEWMLSHPYTPKVPVATPIRRWGSKSVLWAMGRFGWDLLGICLTFETVPADSRWFSCCYDLTCFDYFSLSGKMAHPRVDKTLPTYMITRPSVRAGAFRMLLTNCHWRNQPFNLPFRRVGQIPDFAQKSTLLNMCIYTRHSCLLLTVGQIYWSCHQKTD